MARNTISVQTSGSYAGPREDWLAQHVEEVIDPGQRIIDAHHHLWDRAEGRYMFDEFHEDVSGGHNIEATVYVDCRSMYRGDGPDHLKSVGEVEFANGVAAMSASGGYGPARLCAAIVGNADLRHPRAAETLEALAAAGNGRFSGIRQISAYTEDKGVSVADRPKVVLPDPSFRKGFAELARMGFTFDAFMYHPQIPELTDLARAFPEARIVLDHVGTPLGVSSYAGRRQEVFDEWHRSMSELAACGNVVVKLGGLGMSSTGFGHHLLPVPPDSERVAGDWRVYIEPTIELFGPDRCMFESNVPPDKGSCSYQVLWNAFKRIAAQYSPEERDALFFGTAKDFYRMELPASAR
jgi:predicted TIM-barrel fold metal-dependent hydrolase